MSSNDRMVIAGDGGHAAVLIEAVRSEGVWTVAALTDPVVRGELLGVPIVGGDGKLDKLSEQIQAAEAAHVINENRPVSWAERIRLIQTMAMLWALNRTMTPSACNPKQSIAA